MEGISGLMGAASRSTPPVRNEAVRRIAKTRNRKEVKAKKRREVARSSVRPDPTEACVRGNLQVWSPREQGAKGSRSPEPLGKCGMANTCESSQGPSSPRHYKGPKPPPDGRRSQSWGAERRTDGASRVRDGA